MRNGFIGNGGNAPRYAVMNHEGLYLNEKDGTWGRKSDCTLYGTPNDGATKIQALLMRRLYRAILGD